MSLIKNELLRRQEEEQELWESYLEWVMEPENQHLFQQLPKNIQELVEKTYEN